MHTAEILLVEPDLPGMISGGFRYNSEVAAILRRRMLGRLLRVTASGGGLAAAFEQSMAARRHRSATWLIDSLFLDEDAAACERLRGGPGSTVAMLFHYLPSTDPAVPDEGRRRQRRDRERRWLRELDCAVVTGRPLVHSLRELGEAGERIARNCVVAEPGLDAALNLAGAADPCHKRAANDRMRLVTVGGIRPGKGQCELLDCLASVAGPFSLTVIGPGHVDREYRRRFDETRRAVASTVPIDFPGVLPHEAALRAMRDADVVVSVSVRESFGMAVAEACALGTPVIAFDTGAFGRWIDDECNGRLLPPGDFAGLAKAFAELAEAPGALSAWRSAAAARRFDFRRYRWDRTVDRVTSLVRR